MVAFEYIKPTRQARICRLEDREVMQILNLVVNVELVQHELQPRHELTREFDGRKLPGTKLRRDSLYHRRQLAKHGMARQPEAGHFTKIGMSVPLLARVTGEQHAQILWPATSASQRKRFNLGGMGPFDRHKPR